MGIITWMDCDDVIGEYPGSDEIVEKHGSLPVVGRPMTTARAIICGLITSAAVFASLRCIFCIKGVWHIAVFTRAGYLSDRSRRRISNVDSQQNAR